MNAVRSVICIAESDEKGKALDGVLYEDRKGGKIAW